MLPIGMLIAVALGQVISEEPVVPSPAPPVTMRSSRQLLAISMGAAAWPGLKALGSLQTPPGWGPFDAWNMAFFGSYRLNVARIGGAELLVGPSAGLMVARAGAPGDVPLDQNGRPNPDLHLVATVLPLTMDARVQLAEGALRPFIEAGAGYTGLFIDVEQGLVTDRGVLDRWRPTWWVGVGGDLRFGPPELCWGLFAQVRLLQASFGPTNGLSEVGTLRGPVYTFSLGALIGVGH